MTSVIQWLKDISAKAKGITWEPLPDYGDLLTVEEYFYNVKNGLFIDYDGHGYYSDGKRMSNRMTYPSHVAQEDIDPSFTHVVWFNR